MKRFLSLVLVTALSLSLVACSSKEVSEDTYEKCDDTVQNYEGAMSAEYVDAVKEASEVPTWPCGTPMTEEEIAEYYGK